MKVAMEPPANRFSGPVDCRLWVLFALRPCRQRGSLRLLLLPAPRTVASLLLPRWNRWSMERTEAHHDQVADSSLDRDHNHGFSLLKLLVMTFSAVVVVLVLSTSP